MRGSGRASSVICPTHWRGRDAARPCSVAPGGPLPVPGAISPAWSIAEGAAVEHARGPRRTACPSSTSAPRCRRTCHARAAAVPAASAGAEATSGSSLDGRRAPGGTTTLARARRHAVAGEATHRVDGGRRGVGRRAWWPVAPGRGMLRLASSHCLASRTGVRQRRRGRPWSRRRAGSIAHLRAPPVVGRDLRPSGARSRPTLQCPRGRGSRPSLAVLAGRADWTLDALDGARVVLGGPDALRPRDVDCWRASCGSAAVRCCCCPTVRSPGRRAPRAARGRERLERRAGAGGAAARLANAARSTRQDRTILCGGGTRSRTAGDRRHARGAAAGHRLGRDGRLAISRG